MAASAAIIKDKKILLIKRSNYTKVFPGRWAFPAGRADDNETPEECVIREVKEEVNLDFEPKEIIQVSKWDERDLYRYIGNWSGEIKIQEEEISEYNWFTFEDAIKLDLAFDYSDVLKILRKKKLL